jgi:predicted ATP-grasp superfamily ATP-dependent carboligase
MLILNIPLPLKERIPMLKPNNKRIIVIGGTKWIFDRAKKLGLEVLLIQKPQLFDIEFIQLVDRVILTDYDSDPSLISAIEEIHRITPFDTCITFTEKALLKAAEINEKLGLPGTSSYLVNLTRDKYLMRKTLEEYDFSQIHYSIGKSKKDILMFAQNFGYPIILKPRDGVGSRGIYYIEDEAQINDIDLNGEFLIEEYLEGPEFSVEAFSFNGIHTIFAITEKKTLPLSFVEEAHKLPAFISKEEQQEIEEYVKRFLSIIGIQDGPTHTEIKMTSKGPRIIETHTRLGGDFIPDLVQLSTGYDLYSITLGWYSGLIDPIVEPVNSIGGASIRYFVPPIGKLENVIGADEALSNRGVVRINIDIKPGDTIPEIKSSRDRVGFVMAIGDSAVDAYNICNKVVQEIKFIVKNN